MHCIINTAKWIVIFIFFEYDSDLQPRSEMHNSHAVLAVNFILENDGWNQLFQDIWHLFT